MRSVAARSATETRVEVALDGYSAFVVERLAELFESTPSEVVEQIMFAWCADHVAYLDSAHASLTDFAAFEQLGTWVKGGERMMQITDAMGREGLKCEVYLCHPPAQWGSILAIRTGPAALGAFAVTRMRQRGLRHEEGRVIRAQGGAHLPTPTEEEFFRLAGIPFVGPAERDALAAELEAGKWPVGAAGAGA